MLWFWEFLKYQHGGRVMGGAKTQMELSKMYSIGYGVYISTLLVYSLFRLVRYRYAVLDGISRPSEVLRHLQQRH